MKDNKNETLEDATNITSEAFLRYFNVYHIHMRDAQIFHGDYNDPSKDIYDSSEWHDYDSEPLMGQLFARDEENAEELTADVIGIHKSNFEASEVILAAEGKERNSKISARALLNSHMHGIEVTVPGNKTVFIYMDGNTPKLAISPDNENDECIIMDI